MNVQQIETPALILDIDLLDENIRIMKAFTDANGIKLRPHYKSHKSTWIARRQVEAGAKGITCATLGEAEDLAQAGIQDILIANVVPQPSKIARIAALAGCCRLGICVDNPDNIAALEAAAALAGTTIHVLVEYDIGMRRCGALEPEEFVGLAKLVEAAPHLVFEGIQAYAGQLSHEEDYEKRKSQSEWVENRLAELIKHIKAAGLPLREVSGSSTGTVEFRFKNSVYTELQAGSYIFMDKAYSKLNLKFKNALFLLTEVISIIGKERIVTCGGLKALTVDQSLPYYVEYPDTKIRIAEEHCILPFVPEGVKIGDRMRLIPGHCCTTVNLHDFIYLIKGDQVIDRLQVVSRGKCR